jgi:hypothetical protein
MHLTVTLFLFSFAIYTIGSFSKLLLSTRFTYVKVTWICTLICIAVGFGGLIGLWSTPPKATEKRIDQEIKEIDAHLDSEKKVESSDSQSDGDDFEIVPEPKSEGLNTALENKGRDGATQGEIKHWRYEVEVLTALMSMAVIGCAR